MFDAIMKKMGKKSSQASAPPPPPPPSYAATFGLDDDIDDDEPQPPLKQPQWSSVDPRNQQKISYASADNAAIEMAYQAGFPKHELTFGTAKFTIVFADMLQYNASGGSRKILRQDFKPPPKPVPLPTVTEDLLFGALDCIAIVDEKVKEIEKNEGKRNFRMKWNDYDPSPILAVMEVIFAGFQQDQYKSKYGFVQGTDENTCTLQARQQVPGYFANVHDQSIFHRKLLSIAGLRNLVIFGPEIFEEMKEKLFAGHASNYKDKTGPHKMKYYTGNVVDLDCTVLRCSDTAEFSAINSMNKKQGLPVYKDGQEFAKSDQCKQIALAQAQEFIDNFVKQFNISSNEMAKRQLVLDPTKEIPVATGNTDRGKWPLWHYNNVGVLSYHVNVPNMPDVYGALLLSPYHLVKAFSLIYLRYKPNTPEFFAAMDKFYDEAVSDSCFNAKWKSIEAFTKTIDAKGSIFVVLDEIAEKNGKLLIPILKADDENRTKEAAKMLELSQQVVGRDEKSGKTRPITATDITDWMKRQDELGV